MHREPLITAHCFLFSLSSRCVTRAVNWCVAVPPPSHPRSLNQNLNLLALLQKRSYNYCVWVWGLGTHPLSLVIKLGIRHPRKNERRLQALADFFSFFHWRHADRPWRRASGPMTVEFLLKTDSEYPKGVTLLPLKTLGICFPKKNRIQKRNRLGDDISFCNEITT